MATNKLTGAFALLIIAGSMAFVHAAASSSSSASSAAPSSSGRASTLTEDEEKLFHDVAFGYADQVRDLMGNPHININAVNSRGDTALILAVRGESDTIVGLLLAHADIDVNAVNPNTVSHCNHCTALIFAAQANNAAIVELLLTNKNIKVNAVDRDDRTALIWAACKENAAIVGKLLRYKESKVKESKVKESKVNVDAVDSHGFTALDCVSEPYSGNPRIAEMLRLSHAHTGEELREDARALRYAAEANAEANEGSSSR